MSDIYPIEECKELDGQCVSPLTYALCGYTPFLFLNLAVLFIIMNTIILILSRNILHKTPIINIIIGYIQLILTAMLLSGISCVQVNVMYIPFIIIGLVGLIIIFIPLRCSFCCGGPECQSNLGDYRSYKEKILSNRPPDYIPKSNCCLCGEMNTFCGCDCSQQPYDPVGVLRELKYENVSHDELLVIMRRDAVSPIHLTQSGKAYHRRRNSDSGDKHHTTFTHSEQVHYESWQEDGCFTGYPEEEGNTIYRVEFMPIYDNMNGIIQETRDLVENQIRNKDNLTSQEFIITAQDLSYGAFQIDSTDKYAKCCRSFCNVHILYNLYMFFGFAPIADYIWRSRMNYVEFKSKKHISSSNNLRVGFDQLDMEYFKSGETI